MTWLLFMLMVQDVDLVIKSPLKPFRAASHSQGSGLWVAEDGTVALYDSEGRAIQQFGGKGKGPKEFDGISALYRIGDSLWIIDSTKIAVWSEGGDFLTTAPRPNAGGTLVPTIQGVLGYELDPSKPTLDKEVFHWIGSEATPIFQFSASIQPTGRKMPLPIFGLNPGLQVSGSGRMAVISDPELFQLHLYDVETRQVVRNISEERAAVRVTQAFVDQKIAYQDRLFDLSDLTYEVLHPRNHPQIVKLFVDPWDKIVVFAATENPDRPDVFAYAWDGERTTTLINTLAAADRVLGLVGDQLAVSVFDDDAEGFALVAPDDLHAFIRERPIDYDVFAVFKEIRDRFPPR